MKMQGNLWKSKDLKNEFSVSQNILIRKFGGPVSLWEQLASS